MTQKSPIVPVRSAWRSISQKPFPILPSSIRYLMGQWLIRLFLTRNGNVTLNLDTRIIEALTSLLMLRIEGLKNAITKRVSSRRLRWLSAKISARSKTHWTAVVEPNICWPSRQYRLPVVAVLSKEPMRDWLSCWVLNEQLQRLSTAK